MPYYISMKCCQANNCERDRQICRIMQRGGTSGADMIKGAFGFIDKISEILGRHQRLTDHPDPFFAEEGFRGILYGTCLGFRVNDPGIALPDPNLSLSPIQGSRLHDRITESLLQGGPVRRTERTHDPRERSGRPRRR